MNHESEQRVELRGRVPDPMLDYGQCIPLPEGLAVFAGARAQGASINDVQKILTFSTALCPQNLCTVCPQMGNTFCPSSERARASFMNATQNQVSLTQR